MFLKVGDTARIVVLAACMAMIVSSSLAAQDNNTTTIILVRHAEKQIEGIDTVVVCTDERANDGLYYSLKGQVKELYLVGQALSPRRLLDSIADAYVVARAL